MNHDALQQWQQKEAANRHGAAIFFTLFSLIALDTVFAEDKEKEKRTLLWLGWGISFILLAFFIIAPEQEAQQNAPQKLNRSTRQR